MTGKMQRKAAHFLSDITVKQLHTKHTEHSESIRGLKNNKKSNNCGNDS